MVEEGIMPTKVYADGGKDKICFLIEGQEPVIKQTTGETTNANEYLAVIHALQSAKNQGLQEVEVFSDSELMVRQLSGEYKTDNQRLKQLRVLVKMLTPDVGATFHWLPRERNLAGLVLEEQQKKQRRKHVRV